MKDLNELNPYRRRDLELSIIGIPGGAGEGCFILLSPVDGGQVFVMAASGAGWDHVSVSRKDRIPIWKEMDWIARKFFKEDEVAIEYHVPVSQHINLAKNCLHLWRSQAAVIPLPPQWMI